MYDAIVVGGGPAGLQATLTIARLHRSALLLDSGSYRNDPAHAMHNFLTHDGTPPEEFRAQGRKELTRYETVVVRDEPVATIATGPGGFAVTTADGSSYDARTLVLATGLRDVLPDIPGLDGLWGGVAAQCPFCHGHELTGGVIAIQGGPHAPRLAAMLAPIGREVLVLAHDHELTEEERAQVAHAGARVVEGRIDRLRPEGQGAVAEIGGEELRIDGFFVGAAFVQAAPFAEQLGLRLLPSGCVEVDAFGRTSLPGVFAAGDLAHEATFPMPMASVLRAAAAGQLTGGMVIQDLVAAKLASIPG